MENTKPYIFISYAHRDSDEVVPIIEALRYRGYDIWYDDGIKPGTEWAKTIADKLKNCTCVLAFISQNYVVSTNCTREITYAQNHGKPILSAFLDIEMKDLPAGIDMQLGDSQAIMLSRYPNVDAFTSALCSASFFADAGCSYSEVDNVNMATFFKQKKKKKALNLILVLAELTYMYFGITAFQHMPADASGIFLAAMGRIVLPQLGVILLGNLLIRTIGRGLTKAERADIESNCLMALVFGVFICLVVGPFAIPIAAGFFKKLLISLIVNVLSLFLIAVPLSTYNYN